MTSKQPTKSESDLKSELVKASRTFGDYARRIEDRFTVGMPDILYGPRNIPTTFLIEAKIISAKTFAPSPRQLYEMELWEKSAHLDERIGLVLGFKDGLFYISQLASIVAVESCFVSDPGEPFHFAIRRFWK